jgi:predicted ribosomally synthesized peptide with nif11-like leader
MSEEQLASLLAKLKNDAELQEKLKGAGDLDTALAMAKDAGFDVSKADWLRYQAYMLVRLCAYDMVSAGSPVTSKSYCQRRSFLFLQQHQALSKAHSIPGTIAARSTGLSAFNRTSFNNRIHQRSKAIPHLFAPLRLHLLPQRIHQMLSARSPS